VGVANPQSWRREGEAEGGRGWLPFERALVSSYRPSIVNFSSIFTRFGDIAAIVLLHATFPYPTSILPQISPCSPENRWIAFSLQRSKVLVELHVIVRAISFKDFLTYVITIHQRHRQTDRRTDGRTDGQVDDMPSQDRALH